MNPTELRDRLSLGEGASLELKFHPDPIATGPHVCAFLNGGGGYVVIGADEQGRTGGLEPGDELATFERAVMSRLSPPALVSFEEHQLEGARLWVIEVPAGKDVPYSIGDEIFVRSDGGVQRAPVSAIRDMVLRHHVEPERWERRFTDAVPERDLDRHEVAAAAREAKEHHRGAGAFEASADPLAALEQLGLIRYGRLTNGGDVLFAANPAMRHPQVRVRAAAYAGEKSGDTYRDQRTFEGPLARVLEQVFSFVQTNTPTRSRFEAGSLARQDEPRYPPEAVREGLVNALAHRDYADFKGGVVVQVFLERLEIWNSGGLPEGVTLDNIASGHLSVLRNPDIANMLYLRGYMERLGRGGMLIKEACAARGLHPPVWEADKGSGVRLTFRAREVTPEVTPEVGGAKIPPDGVLGEAPEVTPEVTPEVAAVLNALAGGVELSRRELQTSLSLKDPEHFRTQYLLPALERGFIEMTIPDKPTSRNQQYRATASGRVAVKYARETP